MSTDPASAPATIAWAAGRGLGPRHDRGARISLDMEGVAGIPGWEQRRPGGPEYALGCELLQTAVSAAVTGAIAGGATEAALNDSCIGRQAGGR